MGSNRNIKADDISNNTTSNVTISPSGDFILNAPNVTIGKTLFVDSLKQIRTNNIDQSNITKNNLNATTEPANTNGSSEDYSVGSFWFDKTYGKLFVCTDPSYTAPEFASFTGQVAGMTTNVTITADNIGTVGNSVSLAFDGIDDIDTAISDWNTANPANTVTLTTGDGSQVPDNLETIDLAGGVDEAFNAVWNRVREIIVDTKANIDGLSRVAGNIYFATDEDAYYGDDGTQLISLGGGGVTVDTLANIQGFTREAGKLYLASDTNDFLGDDGTILQSLGILRDTKANLDSKTRFEGAIVYATDLKQFFGDDGTQLISLGGNNTPVDIYYTENFEITKAADLQSGNGTFLGGGVLAGTLTDVAGDDGNIIRFTQAAGSLNDYFAIENQTIGNVQQGKTNTAIIYTTYDGNANEIRIIPRDLTNSQDLIVDSYVTARTGSTQRHEIKFFMPESCVSLGFGFQVDVLNNGAVLDLYRIELNTNPFQFTSLLEEQWIRYTSISGNSSAGPYYFANAEYNRGEDICTVETNDATDGWLLRANKKCSVYLSAQASLQGPSFGIYFGLNDKNPAAGTGRIANAWTSTANYIVGTSVTLDLEPNDFVIVRSDGASGANNALYGQITVHAQAVIDSLVSNNTIGANWTDYTPTTQGVGAPTFQDARWKRQGDSVLIQGKFTTGTVTADEFQLSLPNDIAVSSAYSGANVVGRFSKATATDNHYTVIATPADTYINIGVRGAGGGAPLTPQLGNFVFANSEAGVSFQAEIKIEGWDLENQFTVISPLIQTCYLKDVKGDGVAGGSSTSDTIHTRDLNTLSGDTSFVSLASNQFTLGAGTYQISAKVPFAQSDGNKAFLYNVTDASYDIEGMSGLNGNSGNNFSFFEDEIVLTSSKTFEVRQYFQSGFATNGLGYATVEGAAPNPDTSEVYTTVKIQKVR